MTADQPLERSHSSLYILQTMHQTSTIFLERSDVEICDP
ncbi:hypothetical protein KL86PLE_40259 [uncultured Pleomorphomonas sp.]|uniref:Uncharacterized protein n=1 Tax=uncultured Pleomorphomonas sp. TaxID=442121 RepID=A0A212LFW4_9HYPH|nr:hypothetical protein KL86PLE_40259 [uncultured Pleomorphomonas sp.]